MQKPAFVIFFLFSLSAIINTYKLNDHLFFGHEQGRDAYAARGIYTLKDLTLIGPKTEIPGIFTPPWYYYFLAIPYGIGGGNPLVATYTQTILVSTYAPFIYLLVRKLIGANSWAITGGIFTVFSFEFISNARWFSNVSPAIPASVLAFYFLASYWKTSRSKHFVLYGIFAVISSVFQVVLIFQFVFVFLLLKVSGIIKFPKAKTLLQIVAVTSVATAPLILFDFRNQHISAKAILDFVSGSSDYPLRLNPLGSISLYVRELLTISKRTLFNFDSPALLLTFWSLVALGLFRFAKNPKNRPALTIVTSFALMGLGIFIFNIGLTQLYPATGIGLILLFTISVRSLATGSKTKTVALALSVLWLVSLAKNLTLLHENRGMFFVTTTEGINYRDQKTVLNFARLDAVGKEYRLESFTVPYLKSEGWQYLHEYFFRESDNKTAKLVYIIVQKNVEDFWRKRWTEELGPSEIIVKKQFGQIELEKRLLTD